MTFNCFYFLIGTLTVSRRFEKLFADNNCALIRVDVPRQLGALGSSQVIQMCEYETIDFYDVFNTIIVHYIWSYYENSFRCNAIVYCRR
jgi:hypothetical protein